MNTGIETQGNGERLIGEIRPIVHGFFRRHARISDHAEDLTQDVLLCAVRRYPSFRGDCPVKHWALSIAATRLKNYYSRDLPRDAVLEPWDTEASWSSDDSEATDAILVQDTIQKILERARSVCSEIEFRTVMFRYHGRTMDEIAMLEHSKPATMRSHLLRGRKKLLADLICNQPDLVGGIPAIEAALTRLSEATSAITSKELDAWRKRKCTSEAYRSLSLKLASQLSPFASILLILMRLPNDR